MSGEAILFLIAVSLAALLLFAMVFFIIMFSDLECDYINPIDLCNRLNQFVLPEYLGHAGLLVLFILGGQWLPALFNVPLVAYHVKRVLDGKHMYDATEIFRTLPQHKKACFFKLSFYLLSFFFYLYYLILALLNSS